MIEYLPMKTLDIRQGEQVALVGDNASGKSRLAAAFAGRTGAKYIVDIMDAWPETFERVAPRWALGWMRHLACGNYRNAAGITAVAQRYLDLAKSYGATSPMHLCYHGIV